MTIVDYQKAELTDPVSKLQRWIDSRPEAAEVLRISEKKLAKHDVIVEYSVDDIGKRGSQEIAKTIMLDCEDWAETNAKITPFVAQWLVNDREVQSKKWKLTPDSLESTLQTGLQPIDGTPESWSASLQAASLQKDRIVINSIEAVMGLFLQLVEHLQTRISWLETQEIEVRRLKDEMVDLAGNDKASEQFNQVMSLLKEGIKAKVQAEAVSASRPSGGVVRRTPEQVSSPR